MRSMGIEFRTEGNSVLCVRYKVRQSDRRKEESVVATFDAEVDRVAPHVAAALLAPERKMLHQWLLDRRQLKQALRHEPHENTVLGSLPALLDEAISATQSTDDMDAQLYTLIKQKLATLDTALEQVDSQARSGRAELKVMNDEEVLKEQLRTIKRRL